MDLPIHRLSGMPPTGCTAADARFSRAVLAFPSDESEGKALVVHGVTVDQVRDAVSRDISDAPRLDAKSMLAALGVDLDGVRASVEANFGLDAVDDLYARRRRDTPTEPPRPTTGRSLAPATCSPGCSPSKMAWRSGCCVTSTSTWSLARTPAATHCQLTRYAAAEAAPLPAQPASRSMASALASTGRRSAAAPGQLNEVKIDTRSFTRLASEDFFGATPRLGRFPGT